MTLKIWAQDLPPACVGSKEVYTVVPDPNFTNSWFRWEIPDNAGVIDTVFPGGNSIGVIWGNVPGIHRIGVAEISDSMKEIGFNGCEGDMRWADVEVRGVNLFIGNDKEICVGDSFEYIADMGFDKYQWKNNPLPDTNIFKYVAGRADTVKVNYTVMVNLTVTDKYNCKNSDTAYVIVHALPFVDINSGGKAFNDTMLCGSQTLELYPDSFQTARNYHWRIGTDEFDSTIIHLAALYPKASEPYKTIAVTVEDYFGCFASDSIRLKRCINPNENNTPTVFTPGTDGKNDTWKIPALEYFPNARVEVYDRWGRMVFLSDKGFYKPWDGKLKGKYLPMGTYYYIIRWDKGSDTYHGTISIIR
jgi:gliding motility-associated-like protein